MVDSTICRMIKLRALDLIKLCRNVDGQFVNILGNIMRSMGHINVLKLL